MSDELVDRLVAGLAVQSCVVHAPVDRAHLAAGICLVVTEALAGLAPMTAIALPRDPLVEEAASLLAAAAWSASSALASETGSPVALAVSSQILPSAANTSACSGKRSAARPRASTAASRRPARACARPTATRRSGRSGSSAP